MLSISVEQDQKCLIHLTRGLVAWVSYQDFERVSRHSWSVLAHHTGKFYAQANIKIEGKWKKVLLHRFILSARKDQLIDHEDRNPLNCMRTNLRFATRGQNQYNSGPRTGRYKGVSWNSRCKKYVAQIMINSVYINLGMHETEEQAARVYDAKAKELQGDFAYLNFPLEGQCLT